MQYLQLIDRSNKKYPNVFITKANHHFNEKGRTIPALSGQIPLEGIGNLQYLHLI
jgi:hypothetical protein